MRRAVTCVFPGLGGPNPGGVQSCGRIAWQALAQQARAAGRTAGVLVYGEADESDLRLADLGLATRSRMGALRTALFRDWRAEHLCFWHVDLLRLLPVLRAGKARVVLVLFGIDAWRTPTWLTRRLLDRVDHFLTISRFTWERFLPFVPELAGRRQTTVHLGLEEPIAGPVPPPGDPPAALILGRMARDEDYKGHRELIGCWPRVVARIPGAELWVAGEGNLRPDLEALARQTGCGAAIRFFGRVSEEQKADLLARCRCLAMPSRGEGFGLVYLEAMRLGRPCLVSDRDAGREVVNPPEAGLAADPADPDALAAAVADLLTPGPQWERWSAAARRRYEGGFTEEHFRRRLTEAVFGS